jgi:hypothetical protein
MIVNSHDSMKCDQLLHQMKVNLRGEAIEMLLGIDHKSIHLNHSQI